MGFVEALARLKRRLFNRSPSGSSERLTQQMDALSVEAIFSRRITYSGIQSFGASVVGDPTTMSSDFKPLLWEKYQKKLIDDCDIFERYSDFEEMDQYISLALSLYAEDAAPLTPKTPLQEFTERVWAEDGSDD